MQIENGIYFYIGNENAVFCKSFYIKLKLFAEITYCIQRKKRKHQIVKWKHIAMGLSKKIYLAESEWIFWSLICVLRLNGESGIVNKMWVILWFIIKDYCTLNDQKYLWSIHKRFCKFHKLHPNLTHYIPFFLVKWWILEIRKYF